MPTYDVHQHLWPESLVAALAARREPPRLRGCTLELDEGTFEIDLSAHCLGVRLRQLDRDGIEVAVVSFQPTLGDDRAPELREAYNDGILELVRDSKGRLRALACGAVLDGFAGTCLAATALLDLDRLAPLLGQLERRGGVLFVHPGPGRAVPRAPAWWVPVVDYTAQMQAAYAAWLAGGAARWPELRVVFAILAGGAPFQLERLASRGVDARTALNPCVYLETASYGHRALDLCFATFGVGQLLYGSDLPVIDPRPTLLSVRGFGQAVADVICGENPTKLFG